MAWCGIVTDDTGNGARKGRPFLRFMRQAIGANEIVARLSHEIATLRNDIVTRLTDEISTLKNDIFTRLTDEISTRLASEIPARLAEDIHRNAAHVDEHLTEQLTQVREHLTQEMNARLNHLQAHIGSTQAAWQKSLPRFMAEEMHRHMSHVDSHLSAHLTKELALQLGSQPRGDAPAGDPRLVQQRLLTLGRLMEPATALGVAKRRIGHGGDGGYVMLDDAEKARFALSLGVGAEMTWDIDMADRGIEVHQFDYTIEAPPATHERIHFHRSRISPVAAGTDHSFASAQALGGNQPCIIKMDIEGDEWAVLEAAGTGDFDRVPQLVCELHDFDRIADTAWYERTERVLRRLGETFRVVHVHANNNGLYQIRGNVAFPEILEITFANRAFYEFGPCSEVFPTALDAPNRPDLPDIALGAFRF
jgi:hypothetical protein